MQDPGQEQPQRPSTGELVNADAPLPHVRPFACPLLAAFRRGRPRGVPGGKERQPGVETSGNRRGDPCRLPGKSPQADLLAHFRRPDESGQHGSRKVLRALQRFDSCVIPVRRSLRRNQLTGALPSSWAMKGLKFLYLAENNLTGTLPALWTGLESIQQL